MPPRDASLWIPSVFAMARLTSDNVFPHLRQANIASIGWKTVFSNSMLSDEEEDEEEEEEEEVEEEV